MTSSRDAALSRQCQDLQLRLQAQRDLIARRIDPVQASDNVFPRSITMRLLTGRGETTARVLTQAAFVLLGSSGFRSLAAASIRRIAAGLGRSKPAIRVDDE